MVFNILIRNTDDHLHNHGFLHVRNGQWELAPAFDVNPFPEKRHVLKLWITEGSGESGSVVDAMRAASTFGLKAGRSMEILKEVVDATSSWRDVARKLKMSNHDIDELADAFEHEQRQEAIRQIRPSIAASKTPVSGKRL
jgi:serine/threonine-protein kinase HipA